MAISSIVYDACSPNVLTTSSADVPSALATSSADPTTVSPDNNALLPAPAAPVPPVPTAPPPAPPAPPTPVPFTTTAPATLMIAPPAIVNICNTEDINSAISVATLSAINLPNQSITFVIPSANPCRSSGNSSADACILSIIVPQSVTRPTISPSVAEPNIVATPSIISGPSSVMTCVKSILRSPIFSTAFAIAVPYFSSIRSHESWSACLNPSKSIS